MLAPFIDVCCARVPSEHLADLADLRAVPGVLALCQPEHTWLRWEAGDERVLQRVLPIAILGLAVVAVPVLIFEPEGLPRLRALEHEMAEVNAENAELKRDISKLRVEVKQLRDDLKRPEVTVVIGRLLLRTWSWGLVCGAALVAVPMWTGHAMVNIKDIPVATGYTLHACWDPTTSKMIAIPAWLGEIMAVYNPGGSQ